ncbi:MAG: 23S rRNA (uracil(1939)-C(5))-methyltransferase RlmD [Halothiobacillaceae bacterium]
MARRRRKPLPQGTFEATIDSLTHEGKGVTRIEGKTVFVDGALPGERVMFRYVDRHRNYDEGQVESVIEASGDRVAPRCPHFGICGGCSLQHLDPARQIAIKQDVLRDNLERLGQVRPENWLVPLTGPVWGYRRKARLGVRYVHKKGRVLVGFRERRSNFIADLTRCEVLHPSVGERLDALSELITGMDARRSIPQIEVAVGDNGTALAFRHMEPLSETDLQRLTDFARQTGFMIYLQPGKPQTLAPLVPAEPELYYRLDTLNVRIDFTPLDFTQVNADINRAMVPLALDLLDPQPDDTVLDLFAGLGNFTLALARRARSVVGVEVDELMVRRGEESARRNGLTNTRHYRADLSAAVDDEPWLQEHYDRVLVDPPRSGALEMIPRLAALSPRRIVYVSCHPGTLARDAGLLVNDHGYRLTHAGVMDMFPHTAHVESIAVFDRHDANTSGV